MEGGSGTGQNEDPDLEKAMANSIKTYNEEQSKRNVTRTKIRYDSRRKTDGDYRKGKERNYSFSDDASVITTEVKPRSRPEGRKLDTKQPAILTLPEPSKHNQQPQVKPSFLLPPPRSEIAKTAGPMDKEQDLISFCSPSPKPSISSLDDLAALDLPNPPISKSSQVIQNLFRDNVCSYRPQAPPSQARVSFQSPSLAPHLSSNTGTSFQTPPRPPLNSNPVLFSNLQGAGASGTPVSQLQVNTPGSGGSWHQFNSLGALPSQTNIAQGGMNNALMKLSIDQNLVTRNQVVSGLQHQYQHGGKNTQNSPLSVPGSGLIKSQSWTTGDPLASLTFTDFKDSGLNSAQKTASPSSLNAAAAASTTPLSRSAVMTSAGNSSMMTAGNSSLDGGANSGVWSPSIRSLISPPPPPPSLRSSVSSISSIGSKKSLTAASTRSDYAVVKFNAGARRKTPKIDNESLIDLDVSDRDTTTVSVLEEFDPLSDNPQDEEDIYWSSKQSSSSFTNSIYDSYDPFSYMADRAERPEPPEDKSASDEADTEIPQLPPKLKKVGVVRPLPEISEAKLTRRKTAARNYENVVKKDATFFKGLGVSKTPAIARDSEILAYTNMVRQIRTKFKYSDVNTNPGVVLGGEISANYPEGTELKLVICLESTDRTDSAVQFTASVNTDLQQIVAKTLSDLDEDICDVEGYYLQVKGRGEYLKGGSLDKYEYVHQCYKYDRDVEFTLVSSTSLVRSLSRTDKDDIEDGALTYDQISPLDKAKTLSHEDLSTLLEFLQKEVDRINRSAKTLGDCTEKNVIQTLNPKGLIQAVKAVTSKLGGVETQELGSALETFSQACVNFDVAKGNEDPAGRLRPEIVEVVGERYAMVTLNRAKKDGYTRHARLISEALAKVTEKVYSLIRTYSRTFRVDFRLDALDDLTPGEMRESVDVEESLLVRVGAVNRVNMDWDFTEYRVDIRVYHGTRLLREAHSTPYSQPEHSPTRLHKVVAFNAWIDIKSLVILNVPLEARMVFCLVGRKKDSDGKDGYLAQELCWTGVQLYSLDRSLSQGPYILTLWPMQLNQQIGPAPDSSSHPQGDTCPLLNIELLDLGGPVVYPHLQPNPTQELNQDWNIEHLDFKTREELLSMCELDIMSFYSRPVQEKEILWEKRMYLRNTVGALPKVLLSVQSWNPETLRTLYGLLQSWPKPEVGDILQLFLPTFADSEVRKQAVTWLSEESTDSLLNYLPQLVEAIKHETWIMSSLIEFLLERCLSSPMLSHSLYWILNQALPGVSPQNTDCEEDDEDDILLSRYKRRLQLILRTLFVISGEALRNRFFAEQILMKELNQAAFAVKNTKDSAKQNILVRHMENLHHMLKTTPSLVPLSASLTANGVDVKNCQYFNSNTFPLKVVLNSAERDEGVIQIIYKVGDDLRQDQLTLQMIRVMDGLWLKNSLDLRIVSFSCVPTGHRSGMVEFVEDAKTLREIQVADAGVTGTFRSETLNEWLQKHNASQLQFNRAVSNFTRSCAGYSVVTYVLGIGDRHNDNIMLKTSGHLFHIDYGKFLGDAQKFGNIKRDRTPFVLTPDMVYVINGGKGSTERFHTFVELCCQAFNILRRQGTLILTLFALMASSGIPGVTKDAVNYVQDRLLLDLSEDEAAARFSQLIHESINSLSTQLNFFVHNLAQLKFGKGGGNDSNQLLSFIPNKYSLSSDGKIKKVVVHGIQKRYDGEKYYVFILKVERLNIKDPTYIFRTYKQFCEFNSRLCTEFPRHNFHSISGGYNIGRSNVREVAEKRKREIATFLSDLFLLSEEISHSDLVYTFFHPLLKDEEETSVHLAKVREERPGHARRPSHGKIMGRIKLKLYYRNNTLHVLIQFLENLSLNDAREEPNSYVKVYLSPDPRKLTKRKTKVVRRSCNPTFMEMLEYRVSMDILKCRTLQASVWESSQFQENMFLGSINVPLDSINLEQGLESWFQLGQFNRG